MIPTGETRERISMLTRRLELAEEEIHDLQARITALEERGEPDA